MIILKTKYNIRNNCVGAYEQDIMDAIYKSRGIEDVNHFLYPKEEDLLPLDSLKNVYVARRIIEEGIENGSKFAVHFDSDTDGASSGAIMTRYLKHFTNNIITTINSGKAHGLLDISPYEDVDIIIVVDSLNSDIENYKKLSNDGKEIIILDHHAINKKIPYDNYVTLISSQRDYNNPDLSGAGVVWKFCKYLDDCWIKDYADEYIDLAAAGILADVCDVSEQSKENRYIIYNGLKNLKNPGMKKILGSYEFNSKAVLFSIAPLINACMRCGNNESAMNLFLSDDNKEVLRLKKELESYKELQNQEVDKLMPDIFKQVESQKDKNVLKIIIDSNYGIGGLIGNKLLEIYNKPMFLIGGEDENNVYGSMRSIGYGNFMKLCNEIGNIKVMGHEEAAGFECNKNLFDDFLNTLDKKLSTIEQTTTSDVEIDCELDIGDVTRRLVDLVHDYNFVSGSGSKPLIFKVTGMSDYNISSWKQGKHLLINDNEGLVSFIEWNTKASFEDMEDNALMGNEIIGIGQLESGFVGRKFMIKLILDDYEVV